MIKSYMISVLSSLLFAAASAQTIAWSADLKCGRCIKGGYNFCFKGNDTQSFNSSTEIESTCCADTNCAQVNNPEWTCSSSYSDPDYAMTFCPFKKNKCGSIQKVEYGENDVNVSQTLTLQNLEAGETCSFMIKSRCNSPGFRVASARKMNDSNVEVSFIEYKKSFINATDIDGYNSSETQNTKRWKMPDNDRPPRNQSWEDMGSQNKTCETRWNQDTTMNITEFVLRLGRNYAVKFKKEQNNTLTITICERAQYRPRRRRNNGTYTERDDMSNATRRKWDVLKTEFVKEQADIDWMDTEGLDGWHDTKSSTETTNRRRDRGDWGSKWDKNKTSDDTTTTDPDTTDYSNQTQAEKGYGKPSKGKYSTDLAGYKSFGTEGQGNSSVGVKDDNDTTCGDRIVLLTVSAIHDTTESSTTPLVQSAHPMVQSTSGSYLSIEVGNYQFLSDITYMDTTMAESTEELNLAKGLITKWFIATILIMASML